MIVRLTYLINKILDRKRTILHWTFAKRWNDLVYATNVASANNIVYSAGCRLLMQKYSTTLE